MLRHAAGCDGCGALLEEAVRLSEPLSASEQARVDGLPSSRPEAVGRLVPGLSRQRPVFLPYLAAAAVLLAVAGVWVLPRWRQRSLDTQIAEAFAESRPIEFRLDGVPHGTYRAVRSEGAPPVTLDAAGAAGPSSWRAAVLANDLDAALARVSSAGPDTAALWNDRAAIHAAQGDRLRSGAEYQAALDLLDRALSLDRNYAAALFNRALALHRLRRREEMRAAIDRFLEVEKDPGWRSEAEALREAP
jgi:tetratricopeptide (TPR) repeat protein